MKFRKFGSTDLVVSEIGFGAWGIGGPSMAGDIAIGWGKVDDSESIKALKKSADEGINFFDTADFYGLGHSEALIGKVFGNDSNILVASKVGHRLSPENNIFLDYSYNYIIEACENSLRRLNREQIDYYQLHSARLSHLENGECIEAMESLKKQGKIRYWGLSLNTFDPFPEAEFMLRNNIGSGFQLVFNIINQRARDLFKECSGNGYGIIARMPLQFGILTGKFDRNTKFGKDDHRAFRLTSEVLKTTLSALEEVWLISAKYGISKTSLALSFIMSFEQVSTVIPGIKTVLQSVENANSIELLQTEDKEFLIRKYDEDLRILMDFIEKEELKN